MIKKDFCKGWKFSTDKNVIENLTLPHDAQLLDGRSKDAPGGSGHGFFLGNVYTYEKKFEVPVEWENKHLELYFEGVYRNCEVELNGVTIGSHKYGYTGFNIDLDDGLKYGATNHIKVTVDNSKLPNSRWYTGGGIYRPVYLLIGAKKYIKCHGVKITTLSINPGKIQIETDVSTATGVIFVEIIKDGKNVAEATGRNVVVEIPDAKLWSEDNPELYEAKVTLMENGHILDEAFCQFGIRKIKWSTKGLYINGKETLLRGGCVHHDNGILGAASFKESEWRKVRILKEQGFNAIRVAHNPASPAMLDACDFYGMYVMDEVFDMWYIKKNKYDYAGDFNECWKEDVESMVMTDYNHPSVIMYSIGNEVSEPGKEKGVEKGKEIINFIKEIDSTRAVTAGINLMIVGQYAKGKGLYDKAEEEKKKDDSNETETKNASLFFNMLATFFGSSMNKIPKSKAIDQVTSPILDALDIAGYNYANGRYPIEKDKHPNRVIVGSETFPYEIGKNWDMVRKYPYLVGDFMWTAWDHLGEAGLGAWSYHGGMPFNRPYPWIISGAGVIDILGNKDASADYAKVVWGLERNPVIGVRPANHPGVRVSKSIWRGTNAIESWSFSNCDGNKVEIDVFADAYQVELYINKKSLGKKKIKNYKALYKTIYQHGLIEAVSFDENGKEIGKKTLQSADESAVKILPEKESFAPEEIAYININIQDENGIVEANNDKELEVKIVGGELLGFGSANPRHEYSYYTGRFTTYYGRSQLIVRVGSGEKFIVYVSDGSKEYTKEIKIK